MEKLTESGAAVHDEECTREVVSVAARAVRSLSDSEFDITFNPDVFQDHVKHTEPEVRITLVMLAIHSTRFLVASPSRCHLVADLLGYSKHLDTTRYFTCRKFVTR